MAHNSPPDCGGSSCSDGTQSSSSPSVPGSPVLELPPDAATQRWNSEGAGPAVPHCPIRRFTEDQVKTLIKAFNKNPYPNSTTKQKLAADMGVKVSTIKNWFKNRRAKIRRKRRRAEPQDHLGASQGRDHDQQRPVETIPAVPHCPSSFRFTKEQVKTLIIAFNKNPYPKYPTMEKLAADMGVKVSTIKNWFQNQRAMIRRQKRRAESQDHLGASQGRDHDQQRPVETIPGGGSSCPAGTQSSSSLCVPGAPDDCTQRWSSQGVGPSVPHCPSSFRFTKDQVKSLIIAFNKNHYPKYPTMEKLAADIGVKVSTIKNWFQYRRSMYRRQRRRAESQDHLGASQGRDQDQQRPVETIPAVPHCQWHFRFTEDQVKALIEAFNKNPYPKYPTMEKLAADMGVKVSKIENWFQNRRSMYRRQKRRAESQDHIGASQGRDHDQQRPVETIPAVPHCPSSFRFTKEQVKTLIIAFNKNPYPNYPTKQKLAADMGVEVSKIEDWFQNRRARIRRQKRRAESQDHLGASQGRDQDQQRPVETIPAVPHCQRHFRFTEDQVKTLIEAFNKNPYPKYPTMQKLAADMGVKVSTIKNWFQNRRSMYRRQKRRAESQDHIGASQGRDHDQQRPVETIPAVPHCQRHFRLTEDQVKALIEAFNKNPYPKYPTMQKLAADMGVEVSKIENWFQNRRAKIRRQKKREESQDHLGASQGRDHDQQRPVETIPAVPHRRRRSVFTKDQLKTLLQVFQQTPNPDYATKQKLAADMGIEVRIIQRWFKNRRAKIRRQKRRAEPQDHLGASQGQDHDQQPPVETPAQSCLAEPAEPLSGTEQPVLCLGLDALRAAGQCLLVAKGSQGGGRRGRACLTASQICTLLQAYAGNPFPGLEAREQLAREVGIPESSVQTWFENRRSRDSRFFTQRKNKPDKSSERTRDQEPDD